jgi:hypothetical protein
VPGDDARSQGLDTPRRLHRSGGFSYGQGYSPRDRRRPGAPIPIFLRGQTRVIAAVTHRFPG